jgi:hypothetical protein
MIDKYTFGKTPAAIYLADRLNVLNDPRYTQRISSRIHEVQAAISDIVSAHENGHIRLQTLNFFVAFMRQKINTVRSNFLDCEQYVGSGNHPMPDLLSVNLMTNVLIGELKSITRRSRQVKILKTKQQRVVTKLRQDGFETMLCHDGGHVLARVDEKLVIPNITLADVTDETTPEKLVERSRKKLARLGKPTTLYDEE